MTHSLAARIGYIFARGAFDALRAKLDPSKVNGGVFLGLDGVVIKSHGGSDAIGTARAIEIGYAMVRHELLHKIREALAVSHEETPLPDGCAGEAACDPPPPAPAEASGR